ncbi:putative ABC transport system ATP-binding protein/lipoprotein-releasing system ATP-binding protein [Erythrobacter litoralis]|uniref:ABC transporter domain-containing protein n=1 Tax=Erythrobacter litoralis TaxID=39960 RepID=A0A074MVT6_9SPHN|nr:ATP-binding cassette domain-containing protein [Erythrobacter litoralis]AOL24136.1 putative ABC transport system ATP-binding protein/lipoprotein-releasing system ATP-binding protein [Erythrobacter litoralis]AOL24159.1 putative ABC transport system ATP-binding protein/lipoprotein-releasing system ATP-binding protein [Erythrobacter litoralis]KEO99101.1 hypothetical protein EH32_04580 [Erythrobacter litoralis]
MTTLCVRDVALSYDGRPVLEQVSFDLAPGSRTLLLGASGSGKSSLLNIVCGLQSPDRGEVKLGEEAIAPARSAAAADRVRQRHMGIIFQTLRLVSALSVRGNLLLAQKLQTGRRDPALVDSVLRELGIADRAHARPFALSQGEAQRAAIARALVVRPKLLIADEPTSALDRDNAHRVAGLLLDAAKASHASLLIATHDERLLPHFEKVLRIERGRIEEGRITA